MKLKPCPFCGEAKVTLRIFDKEGLWEPSITCPCCGIGFCSGVFGGGIDVEDVESHTIESWNNRQISS